MPSPASRPRRAFRGPGPPGIPHRNRSNQCSEPAADSAAATSAPEATSDSAAASSGARGRSGPGPGTCSRSARAPPPSPAPGAAAPAGQGRARRTSARRRGSGARLVSDRRSLRAAAQPIDTWSSCMPEVGIESDAGRRGEQPVLGHQRRRGVLGDHQARVDARVGARKGGSPCERVASSSRSIRRSAIAPTSAAAMARKSQAKPSGRAVEVAVGLDPAVGQDHRVVDRRAQLAGRDRCRMGERVARGARHLRRAAHRVGVLHPRVAVAVGGHDRPSPPAAGAGWRHWPPGPGGGGARAGRRSNARSVPSSASTVIAAVISAVRNSCPGSSLASTSMPACRRCR